MTPLAITPGEPGGIGPELVLQLALRPRPRPWLVIADRAMLAARAAQLGLQVNFTDNPEGSLQTGELAVLHVPLAAPARCGELVPEHASALLQTLDLAVAGCQQGRYAALVTGPLQKSLFNDAGIPFSGHTEYLCGKSQAEDVVMLLTGAGLRVALATTHLPLREVADAIQPALLERRLKILHRALREQFGLDEPRILVCGLNPHAGEGGHLGSEEQQVIAPTLDRLRTAGMNLVGPLPADTLFTDHVLREADAVMAMYHDQGLPVLKHASFGHAVNVTLGLPFVRTSVDHGTALDLAGQGRADSGSLAAALALAHELSA